jgi:regulator of sirC expression with transglutaminase-like and TPR domain
MGLGFAALFAPSVATTLGLVWLIAAIECGEAPLGDSPASTAPSDAIESLIAALDDDRFGARETAQRRLLAIGEPALAALLRRREGASHEMRHRAERIAQRIGEDVLAAEFARLADEEVDARIDLERGMWLIARIGNPLLGRAELSGQLDEWAAAARRQLGEGVDPAKADPQEVVRAMCAVLFGDDGFVGVMESPDNSSLEMVLRNKRGLPILLSHVTVAVADRMGVPIVGLATPYRYMVKYEGSRAPEGYARDDIIFDPYNAGRVIPRSELSRALQIADERFDLKAFLIPSSKRESLLRMLRNLELDYLRVGLPRKSVEVAGYRRTLELVRDRGDRLSGHP